jgi:hypothetical protein
LADFVKTDNVVQAKYYVPVRSGHKGRIPEASWQSTETMLKVKVEVAHPLALDSSDIAELEKLEKAHRVEEDSVEVELLDQLQHTGTYVRAILKCDSSLISEQGLEIVFNEVNQINMQALGMSYNNDRDRQLFSQYKLSRAERDGAVVSDMHTKKLGSLWM